MLRVLKSLVCEVGDGDGFAVVGVDVYGKLEPDGKGHDDHRHCHEVAPELHALEFAYELFNRHRLLFFTLYK